MHSNLCTYTHAHIHTYIHTYIDTYIHTHIVLHTYIHTYTHTYANTYLWACWRINLVEKMLFDRRIVASNPALVATRGPWASLSFAIARSASAFKLRHSVNCCGRERL